MTTIAIISDTHIPSRASRLPSWVVDEVSVADLVVHAGDFDSKSAFERIEDLAPELVAVRGNTDPDLGLPEVAQVDVDGFSFVVTHGTGSLGGYQNRVLQTVRANDPTAIGISGHTHELNDTRVGRTRLLNPGSATGASPASEATMMQLEVSGSEYDVNMLDEP